MFTGPDKQETAIVICQEMLRLEAESERIREIRENQRVTSSYAIIQYQAVVGRGSEAGVS